MHCPKCGTEMETTRTITRKAFTVRLRQCANKVCGTKFVTEEIPGDPRVYHRLAAEETSRRRNRPRRPRKHTGSSTHAE